MKKLRIDPWSFNPEKFPGKDTKKSSAADRPSLDEILSITFSKPRRRALIARLEEKVPRAFYRDEDRDRIHGAITAIQHEIQKELESMNVARDERLVNFLFYDVIRDPAWRRARRAKNA